MPFLSFITLSKITVTTWSRVAASVSVSFVLVLSRILLEMDSKFSCVRRSRRDLTPSSTVLLAFRLTSGSRGVSESDLLLTEVVWKKKGLGFGNRSARSHRLDLSLLTNTESSSFLISSTSSVSSVSFNVFLAFF